MRDKRLGLVMDGRSGLGNHLMSQGSEQTIIYRLVQEKDINVPNGCGTPLGQLDYCKLDSFVTLIFFCDYYMLVSVAITKFLESDDVIKAVHSLCYACVGVHGQRRRNLLKFRGFDQSIAVTDIEYRILDNRRKWTLDLALEVCDLFGLDKAGTRPELCRRIAAYCIRPHQTRPRTEVPASFQVTNTRKVEHHIMFEWTFTVHTPSPAPPVGRCYLLLLTYRITLIELYTIYNCVIYITVFYIYHSVLLLGHPISQETKTKG